MIKGKWRKENGVDAFYEVVNESYDDEYGRLKIDYVPYRTVDGVRKRLSPPSYALSQWDAEQYLRFGKHLKCEHCGSVYFKEE